MKVKKEQIYRIYELVKGVETLKDLKEKLHMLFSKKKIDMDDGIVLAMSDMSEWMMTEDEKGEWNIEEEIIWKWNYFIRKISSPIKSYAYQSKDEFEQDYIKLKELIILVCTAREETVTYELESRIPGVSENFVGREEQICEIHRRLQENNVLVLYGMAGIGKSELAKAYINRYEEQYENIIFCSFERSLQETIIDDYQLPIKNLSFLGKGKRAEKGWYFRKKQHILWNLVNENTLLVIDNFDVLEDERLNKIVSLPCKILFTSRTNANIFLLPGMHVQAFCRVQEQKELFLRYYKGSLSKEDDEYLEQILSFYRGHIFSIKFIALQLHEKEKTLKNFYEELEKEQKKNNDCDEIREIFHISELPKKEKQILRYLSIMPLYGIELSKLIEWCQLGNDYCIKRLIAKGYLEWDGKVNRVFMHPLVSRTVRQEEKVSFKNCRPYIRTLCKFGHLTWRKTVEEMRTYEHFMYQAVESLQDSEKSHLFDLGYLVNGLWQLGYFEMAEKFALELYEEALKKQSGDSLLLVHLRHNIGTVYDNWDKRDEAAKWFRAGYEGYKNCENPQGYYYALITMKYGKILRYEGEYEKAESILLMAQKYLADQIKENPNAVDIGYIINLGPPALMDVYMELAEVYLAWKKPKEAFAWLKIREKEFTERKLYLAGETSQWHLYYKMGLCYMMMNDFEGARTALDQSYSYANRFFFEDSRYINLIKEAYQQLERLKEEEY